MQERNRMCTLQENLIVAAKEAELQERPTVQSNQIIFETRPENLAIKSRHEIQLLILLKKLPPSKLQEYDNFPLCSQLGFLHAIPEESFNVSMATITDVSFIGFFPKRIHQELRRYYREIENITPTASGEFQALMDKLIDAFVHRPITIQKVIHILIAQHKEGIDKLAKRREALANPASDNNMIPTARSNSLKAPSEKTKTSAKTSVVKRQCYATKCRLLQAKGIVLRPMFCVTGRNMCSGCSNESSRQRKVLQLEKELLQLSVDNAILAPLLEYKYKPTSIKHFRKLLLCLPAFAQKKSRDDHIFGAARYLANTLGILLVKQLLLIYWILH